MTKALPSARCLSLLLPKNGVCPPSLSERKTKQNAEHIRKLAEAIARGTRGREAATFKAGLIQRKGTLWACDHARRIACSNGGGAICA
jgi:hypothetical protein